MYPSRFGYELPKTVEEAVALLDAHGGEAKVLAGGQSLVPMMRLRFAAPEMLIDINGVPHIVKQIEVKSPSARGAATLYKIRYNNMQSGQKLDETYKGDDIVKDADCEKVPVQYSYQDADNWVFMNTNDYSQYEIPNADMEDFSPYITEGLEGMLGLMMDGKLLLVTNVADLSAQAIVDRYKSLADIKRGFKVLKSEIEIAPVFHRLPERIRAHASICFMALILYRVMRQRLKAAGHSASPESALAQLRKIQRQSVAINQGVPVSGISNIHREQADLLAAMNIRKPVPDAQLSLL